MSAIARLFNFVASTASSADDVDAEFDQIINHINTQLVHKDGSVAMTGALTLPGNPTLALQAAPKQYVDALVTTPALPGIVTMWGGTVVPAGWLECNGQAVSRATYANLFANVGIAHGAGNGSTTFNVPDLRGRAPFGLGSIVGGTVPWTAGSQWGSEWMQAHTHEVGMVYESNNPEHLHMSQPGKLSEGSSSADGNSVPNAVTGSAGVGGSQNIPPGVGIMFIIKT